MTNRGGGWGVSLSFFVAHTDVCVLCVKDKIYISNLILSPYVHANTGGDGDEPDRHFRPGAPSARADRPQDRVSAPDPDLSHGHHGHTLAQDEFAPRHRPQSHRGKNAQCFWS